MRPGFAIIAASVFVGASVAAAPAASSTPATPDIPVVRAAASSTLPCSIEMSIIGAGRYREIRVSDTTSPRTITEIGEVPGGSSVRSLATGHFHSDFGFKIRYHLGNTSTSLFSLSARDDQDSKEITVTSMGRGWGGFRRLVSSGEAVESTSPVSLYGLHDNGSIYRYRVAAGEGGQRVVTGAGSVAGFSDLKTIALIGVTSSHHALLANTTSGQLVVIKIPTSSTMTATRTVIRTRTWQGFEHLAVADCNEGSTNVLVGIDHDTSSAYAYSMAFLKNTTSSILGHGQVAGSWPWLVFTSLHEAGNPPQGA